MKVFTVIGARPQFIKAAAVSRAFKEHRSDVREILVHTGQHYDGNMSDVFFDELDIPQPDCNLGIGGGTHGQNTGRMLEQLESQMIIEAPDWVLVYGDTDSTLAGALAAAKLRIPVAHVEAGLRSFNRRMPEEINRVLTDNIASLLFAPTETARTNLRNEGIAANKVNVVGDVMYDVALFYKNRALKPIWFEALGIEANEFVLCTIHRAENTDDRIRMEGILAGLKGVARPIILPLHPRTRHALQRMGLLLPSNVHVVDPVGYLEMVWLEGHCYCVATDSGGVQKEAYFHKKLCVTLRDETEWVELLEAGANCLAGADANVISDAINTKQTKDDIFTSKPYGLGHASKYIVNSLIN